MSTDWASSLPLNAKGDYTLHVFLKGLTVSTRKSSFDLFCPQHRRGSSETPSSNLTVEHLDTTSTWRNISVAQADELFLWEKVFQVALEDTLSSMLQERFRQSDVFSSIHFRSTSVSLCQFVNRLGRLIFNIETEQLISEMIKLYEDYIGILMDCIALPPGDIREAVCHFLRTRDCFIDLLGNWAQVELSFSAHLENETNVRAIGEIHWQAPNLALRNFVPTARSFSKYYLFPQLSEPSVNDIYPPSVIDSNYELTGEYEWIWERCIGGFCCRVPEQTTPRDKKTIHNHPYTCHVLLVTTKQQFNGDVFYERKYRHRISISTDSSGPVNISPLIPNFITSPCKASACSPIPSQNPRIGIRRAIKDRQNVAHSGKPKIRSTNRTFKERENSNSSAKENYYPCASADTFSLSSEPLLADDGFCARTYQQGIESDSECNFKVEKPVCILDLESPKASWTNRGLSEKSQRKRCLERQSAGKTRQSKSQPAAWRPLIMSDLDRESSNNPCSSSVIVAAEIASDHLTHRADSPLQELCGGNSTLNVRQFSKRTGNGSAINDEFGKITIDNRSQRRKVLRTPTQEEIQENYLQYVARQFRGQGHADRAREHIREFSQSEEMAFEDIFVGSSPEIDIRYFFSPSSEEGRVPTSTGLLPG